MANYKLGPVIGKIGGAGIETFSTVIDREVRQDHLTTIDVPPGERWMVAWVADLDMQDPGFIAQNARPYLWVGLDRTEMSGDGTYVGAIEAAGSVEISLQSRSAIQYHALNFHLFAGPLPN